MGIVVRFIAAFALVAVVWPAAASEVLKGPAPDWIDPQTVPEPKEERLGQVKDGIYYLLFDRQAKRTKSGEREHFTRIVYQITERAGLEEGASLSWTFRPESERLTIHSIRIIRDGQVIDLTDATEFTVVRRETDLERGLLNGELTAHTDLRDVRVGDVVDYEVTRNLQNLIAPDHFGVSFAPEFSVPLGRFHFRVVWPNDRPSTMEMLQDWTVPEIAEDPSGRTYTWAWDDRDPVRGEDDVPAWRARWGAVWISSMQGWGEVVEALLPHYDVHALTLPPDFAAEVDRIGADTTHAPERIARTLRLVQDRIRYVGIEIGFGAFIARPPETVIARGFGDCKDKTVLLVAALQRLGIDAAPALVDLESGRALDERTPSPGAFDHMIVHVRANGRDWWLDPTNTYQGGTGMDVTMAEYGFALPLRAGTDALVKMAHVPLKEPNTVVTERLKFGQPDGSVALEVTTVRTGSAADWMRRELAAKSPVGLGQSYLEFYAGHYPGLEQAKPLSVSDNRDLNRVVVVENYRLPSAAATDEALRTSFPLLGTTLHNVLVQPKTYNRQMPVWQPYEVHYRHTALFENSPVTIEPPQGTAYDGPYFTLKARRIFKRTRQGIEWTLRTKVGEVPAADAADYVRDVRKMENTLSWYYDLTVPAPEVNDSRSILKRLFDGLTSD